MSFELVDAILKGGPERSADKLVLIAIASFQNAKTGRCDPSMAAVAERASMTERGARSIIRRLEADGWLSVSTGGGRAGCSTYHVNTERHSGFTGENPEHGSPFQNTKPGTPCTETRNATTQNPERHSVNPEPRSAEPRRTKKNKEGGNPPAGADCAAIDGEIISDAAGDPNFAAQFSAIYENWPRKSGEAEARKAFFAAIASGASIEDIARGAAAYVLDRRADRRGPAAVVRYTTGLAKWLNGREWEAWTGLPEAEARAAAQQASDFELIQERARAREARRGQMLF
ncbi:helix-turn-helix domain-containing protein [Rhodobacter capsulatus]|uniref:helix-turn-helix domain-containing protein n=1 Tax=Rhodobacter capsulatus TaxID=1061 RepID=UPI0006DD1885|nr:helix-turn-helix domain-containing protein [Rhodobacter capsulatus]KQB12539.1 hypothetical protein AP071_07060 [Rhodobacter capsulatus]KQB16693.1 hypothetical protein AP073_10385 [Rhodobacter capsulatus]PZX26482.1 helix-turn-helix protein [Rhodobacter capsulatus]QNR61967.1 helix-turn-helix domain-containing protein [Rhodobacter capsulatus]